MTRSLLFIFLIFFCCSCLDSRSQEDKIGDKLLCRFAKEMEQKGLLAVGIGGGIKDGKINLFSIVFQAYEVLEKETARQMIVEASLALLNLINSATEYKDMYLYYPVDIKLIHIGIIGKEPDNDDNYLFSVGTQQGKVHYSIDNRTWKVKRNDLDERETFEEAVRIVQERETPQ